MDEKKEPKTPPKEVGLDISKGVDAYGYNSKEGADIPVLMPSADYSITGCSQDTKDAINPWQPLSYAVQSTNVQINLSDICWDLPDNPGLFVMIAGNLPQDFGFNAEIYPITGEIGSSTAIDMLNTPAVINQNTDNISWGLYRAGPGNFGLTDQYQAYLYMTDDQTSWMGNLVNYNPGSGQKPFNAFFLSGAHDAGMFDSTWLDNQDNLQAINAILAQVIEQQGVPSDLTKALLGNSDVQEYLERFLVYFAFTQKEQVSTLLNLGVRYFDFRPGHIAKEVQDQLPQVDTRLYHQHDFIPGYPYDSFLTDVLTWLESKPSEIVVISLSTNGFYDHSSMDPSTTELEQYWNNAVGATGSTVQIATKDDLSSSYEDLIQDNKRVFFLNNLDGIAADYYPASKFDTYDKKGQYYATFDPNSLVDNVLNDISSADQAGQDYSVVQIQGTCTEALATNIQNEWNDNKVSCGKDIVELVAACIDSNAASFLMSTKPSFDSVTYPWVYQNLAQKLPTEQLTIVLNDFVDNALTDICSALTATRLKS